MTLEYAIKTVVNQGFVLVVKNGNATSKRYRVLVNDPAAKAENNSAFDDQADNLEALLKLAVLAVAVYVDNQPF